MKKSQICRSLLPWVSPVILIVASACAGGTAGTDCSKDGTCVDGTSAPAEPQATATGPTTPTTSGPTDTTPGPTATTTSGPTETTTPGPTATTSEPTATTASDPTATPTRDPTGTTGTSTTAITTTTTPCLVGPFLQTLQKSHLLLGASMTDTTAGQAAFDLRYMYLSGGIFDGSSACTSCASGCTANGVSCQNGACAWWGCWQWDQLPPGQYATDFLNQTKSRAQIPMFTYYELLHTSKAAEGTPEVSAATNATLMRRYFADWRFLLQKIGTQTAFLHIEPDFWGYAQMVNANPHLIPAAVASANPTDCANQENTIAGMGRCMIAMVRKYAPNAKVGLHASGWATRIDVLYNRNTSLDVQAEARKVGAFLTACGAGAGDFVAVETSDRDAGYYASIGQNRYWDATNATLPNFRQGFTWAKALAESVNRPLIWWQMPVGSMALSNTWNTWRDNRLDYFFDHPDQVTAAHGAGMAFGAGASGMTTPESDGGHLVSRVRSLAAAGGAPVCH